jgi:hypothetical protein
MKDLYRHGGCVAQLMMLPLNTWLITHIGTVKVSGRRGKGDAQRCMELITADADAEHAVLLLTVSPDPDTDEERLRAWYRRNGFGDVAADEQGVSMRRDPVVLHWCAVCGHHHYGAGPLNCPQLKDARCSYCKLEAAKQEFGRENVFLRHAGLGGFEVYAYCGAPNDQLRKLQSLDIYLASMPVRCAC